MEKLITRKTRFEGKEKDFSFSQDYRILGVEKLVLDFINEYKDYDEDTTYEIYLGEELTSEFTRKDFISNDMEKLKTLSIPLVSRKVLKIELVENLIKPQKKNENDDAVVFCASRLVRIYA